MPRVRGDTKFHLYAEYKARTRGIIQVNNKSLTLLRDWTLRNNKLGSVQRISTGSYARAITFISRFRRLPGNHTKPQLDTFTLNYFSGMPHGNLVTLRVGVTLAVSSINAKHYLIGCGR